MNRWKLWLYGSLVGIAIGIPIMLATEIPVSMIGIVIGSGLASIFINRKRGRP